MKKLLLITIISLLTFVVKAQAVRGESDLLAVINDTNKVYTSIWEGMIYADFPGGL